MLQRTGELIAAELDAPRQHVGDQRRGAAERDVIHLDAGVALEHLAAEIHDAARPGRAIQQRLVGFLGVVDELLEVADRHVLGGEEEERHPGADRHRDEVVERVPRALHVHQRRRGGAERDVAEQQRVPVGRRLGDLIGADRSAAAAHVLDHERLSHRFGEALRDQPRQHVGGGAGRERHDDADVAARELRLREHRRGEHRRAAGCRRAFEDLASGLGHVSLPRTVFASPCSTLAANSDPCDPAGIARGLLLSPIAPAAHRTPPSSPGLTRRSMKTFHEHQTSELLCRSISWIAGSSPAMTIERAPALPQVARDYTTIITGFSISLLNAPINSAPSAPSTAR